ncbi:MAG: ABC transporter substrate-binding protein [Azospirillum brasilense]|nr:MAG: ABC transporter substrate-binding protein [Azospirillum brasilense]
MQNFRVSATGHSVNYLPEYVAGWKGFFAEEGLAVSATVPRPWDLVLDQLGAGEAEAALGGIWVPSMYLGRAARYVPFAQVSARAPLAIMGREAPEDFDWSALPGSVVAMKGSNGASVGLFVKHLLREQGVDPGTVGFIQDLDGAMLSRLFRGGMGDYLVIDYPSALALEASGGGRVVAPLPVTGGDVPWSVYYAEGEADPAQLETRTRFARALGRGMRWIQEHEAAAFRGFLAQTFPRLDGDLLARVVDLYRAHGMWTTPRIDEAAYDRWQRGIAEGHLIAAPIPYHTLVDARPTEAFGSGRA